MAHVALGSHQLRRPPSLGGGRDDVRVSGRLRVLVTPERVSHEHLWARDIHGRVDLGVSHDLRDHLGRWSPLNTHRHVIGAARFAGDRVGSEVFRLVQPV